MIDKFVNILSSNLGIGESNPNSPGSFEKNVDRSAERSYIEDGVINRIRPRSTEIMMQEPDITVVVTKRAFSSLAGNYRTDLMSNDEKLFLKATKKLFQNKCNAIASYERLCKIERVSKSGGIIDEWCLPQVFSAIDTLSGLGLNVLSTETLSTLNTIRRMKMLSDPSFITNWTTDSTIPYVSEVGEGNGTFELTLVSSLSITNSIKLGASNASLTIQDPYKMMVITRNDIDIAISQSTSMTSNGFTSVAQSNLEQVNEQLKYTLNRNRSYRGVSLINFQVNKSLSQSKKVRAIIADEAQDIIFSFDSGFLGFDAGVSIDSSGYSGRNGLSKDKNNGQSEEDLFKQIICNIYQLLGLEQSTQNQIKNYTERPELKHVYKKMMLNYNGKTIIQNLDKINVFISSKTSTDANLTSSLNPNVTNPRQNVATAMRGIGGSLDAMRNMFTGGSSNNPIEIEKNAIVGADFPSWLWGIMRNDFTRQSAGTHRFGGVVNYASHNWNNGSYILSIKADNNDAYLKMGNVNINPSIDVYNNTLYDPLTPFSLDFDPSSGLMRGEIPELLDENKKLLNSGSVTANNGRFRGLNLTEEMWKITDSEYTPKGIRKVHYDPDGFVYRWKEGIGTLVWDGTVSSNLKLGSFASESSVSINANPFAGQDVVNVLSLLISGIPYNYSTFVKAAVNSNSISRNELKNEGGARSYLRGLVSDIAKQNAAWGNFIPFKKFVISDAGFKFLQSGQFDVTEYNAKIDSLIQQRAELFDKALSLGVLKTNNPMFYNSGNSLTDSQLYDQLSTTNSGDSSSDNTRLKLFELDVQIKTEQRLIQQTIGSVSVNNGTLSIVGNDISFDPEITNESTPASENEKVKQRSEFRKKIAGMTQRRLWKVKANDDQNLLIVDDSYDKNFDIQAFNRDLNELKLFNSEYKNVFENIDDIRKILGLEVFADSQGHIQIRPPQYNRMPSSVFQKMIREKSEYGTQIFPEYLESLFFNQVQGLSSEIEIVEDEIRVRAAALGAITDESCQDMLKGNIGSGDSNFVFVTNSDGNFGTQDFSNLINQANPDLSEDGFSKSLDELNTSLFGQLKKNSIFDITRRVQVVNSPFVSNDSIESVVEKLINRLEQKKGNSTLKSSDLLPNKNGVGSQGNALKLTRQIADLISSRQNVIRLLYNAIKNLKQGLAIDNKSSAASALSFPSLSSSKAVEFPEILENMIEDESYDDYGYGSGSRYIITDGKIISLEISENAPPWNSVRVNGKLSVNSPSPAIGQELGFGDGGNMISTAYAVDYSMWEMYGFKEAQFVNVEFLSDPVTQLAPYATYLLNLARREVLKGSVTTIGNEFTQPGEVYYIEDRDLLFYAESITDSFTYGSTYTTQMTLTYGRNPGEYIPTMLDIIGKGIYTRRNQANLSKHVRHRPTTGDQPIGVLIIDVPMSEVDPITEELKPKEDVLGGDGVKVLLSGRYGEQNKNVLNNIMLQTTGLFNTSASSRKMKIEIRNYYNSKKGIIDNKSLAKVSEAVKSWIVNPQQLQINQSKPSTIGAFAGINQIPDESISGGLIDAENVIIAGPIDLSKPGLKTASSPARSAAKIILDNNGSGIGVVDDSLEDSILASNVLDIWAVFVPVEPDAIETKQSSLESQIQLNEQFEAQKLSLASR